MVASGETGNDAAPSQPVDSVRSVDRALGLLAALESAGRPMRLTELASASRMHKAKSQRMLAVLERHGFVERQDGRYQIGVAVLPLAHAFLMGNNLTKAALPILQELAQAFEETASLFVRLGFHRVVIQRVEGPRPLRYAMPIGRRLPLHLGVGKVLAAAMPQEELRQMLDQLGEIRLASGDVLSREDLLARLERIRQRGFDVSCNERTIGVVSVGAPVLGPDGATVAAIAVIGPSERMTEEKMEHLSVEVRRAAQALSERYCHM